MNINEIIANTALKLSGKNFGDYDFIHPIDDVNLSQSTNDTFVTALKIASIVLLRELTASFAELQRELQKKENEFSGCNQTCTYTNAGCCSDYTWVRNLEPMHKQWQETDGDFITGKKDFVL